MTPEDRIAQLEAEVRSLRLVNEAQAIALKAAATRLEQEGEAARLLAAQRDAARLKKQRQRALKGSGVGDGRAEMSRDSGAAMSPGLSRDDEGTTPAPPPPFPSSFPPSPAPSSPYPLSFPPSSPPPSASQEPQAVPERPELVLKAPKLKTQKQVVEKPTDPRHAPLSLALVTLGWPHHGGRTAKALAALLAHADREPGVMDAKAEILRRAGIARAWEGFPQAKEIHELAANWGHFSQPQKPRGAPALDVRRGSVRAELIDHTKPEEPF